jgi:hypothetical protein
MSKMGLRTFMSIRPRVLQWEKIRAEILSEFNRRKSTTIAWSLPTSRTCRVEHAERGQLVGLDIQAVKGASWHDQSGHMDRIGPIMVRHFILLILIMLMSQGEIDIIEGVNSNGFNQMTLHTYVSFPVS